MHLQECVWENSKFIRLWFTQCCVWIFSVTQVLSVSHIFLLQAWHLQLHDEVYTKYFRDSRNLTLWKRLKQGCVNKNQLNET